MGVVRMVKVQVRCTSFDRSAGSSAFETTNSKERRMSTGRCADANLVLPKATAGRASTHAPSRT